ncbi:elongation factor 1-gamma [Lycorma delicatula]|uniref:elongation factor 1-gamma n=1 Tax=Lycorma delicatula TaxID=130591 RepID=UPI003F516938
MASGTLYTYPENFRAFKALIAAQYAGGNVTVAPGFVFGETNKSEGFLKKFPLGKVPAFESNDGQYITESNAIAYYVANAQLRGKNDVEKAQIIQWLSFADSEILPSSCTWVFPCLGIMKFDKQAAKQAKDDIKVALEVLNKHLLNYTYLVGERITLADIGVACTLLHLYQYVLDPAFRQPFQNVNRWFKTMINQSQFKAVIGEFKLADKMAEPQPVQQNKAPKKDTPNKAEKKQQQKPAVQHEENKPDGDDEEAIVEEGFVMDSFKKVYSNQAETVSIPYFWEKFDKEKYSIWFGEYKYNDELTKVFMSCNLISGMFQRLDKLRKIGFASVCLFGTDNNSTISGVWVWEGQDLAFERSPDWQIDYESYQWTKLDPASEETKKLVDQYFSWTGTDKEGRKFNQGKIFK